MSHVIERQPARRGRILALVGGLVVLVVLVVGAVLLIGRGDDPATVTRGYFTAQSRADLATVCELSSTRQTDAQFKELDVDTCGDYVKAMKKTVDDGAKQIEDATGETLATFLDDLDLDLTIGDVTQDGDEARVVWKSTTTYTGDNERAAEELSLQQPFKDAGTALLCREDGDWKLAVERATDDDTC